MFQDLGLQSGSFSKSWNPHREDVILKAESCGDLSRVIAAGFGLCDLYIQASLELWVSFQGTQGRQGNYLM